MVKCWFNGMESNWYHYIIVNRIYSENYWSFAHCNRSQMVIKWLLNSNILLCFWHVHICEYRNVLVVTEISWTIYKADHNSQSMNTRYCIQKHLALTIQMWLKSIFNYPKCNTFICSEYWSYWWVVYHLFQCFSIFCSLSFGKDLSL